MRAGKMQFSEWVVRWIELRGEEFGSEVFLDFVMIPSNKQALPCHPVILAPLHLSTYLRQPVAGIHCRGASNDTQNAPAFTASVQHTSMAGFLACCTPPVTWCVYIHACAFSEIT